LIQDSTLQRLRRMEIITKNYHALRGLQGMSSGILLLAIATLELGLHRSMYQLMHAAPIAWCGIFLLPFLLRRSIGHYYNRQFGYVQQIQGKKLNRIIGSLVVAVPLLGAILIDSHSMINLPVSVTGLALAWIFFYQWQTTNEFRHHLLIMAFLLLWVSLMPLTGGLTPLSKLLIPGHGGYELVLGLLGTVGGLCDHLLLIRAFRDTRQAYHDQTI